ncbi:MAG: hypothetical protein ACLQNE_41565 [Thermoguttaceae bacterium]
MTHMKGMTRVGGLTIHYPLPSHRTLQKAMLAAGGTQRAAEIAEEALRTRAPVRPRSC